MLKVESFGIIPFKKDEQGLWKVLLILHKKGNHWGFPKGKADLHETNQESAKRELQEETGLCVEAFLREEPIKESYQFRHKAQKILKDVYYFPAIVRGDLVLQVQEIRDAKWISFEEAMQQLSFKEARHILTQCIEILGTSS